MYTVMMKNDANAEPEIQTFETREEAVERIHRWFSRWFEFEIRDGKPYDPGNEDGGTGGYDAFAYATIETINGKQMVSSFCSAFSEGPRGKVFYLA